MKEIIVFFLSDKEYGIEISGMQSLENYREIQHASELPDGMNGLVQIRDDIYPVYDMIQSTGLPILMHMGDPRTTRSHPRRLANVLKEFPHLRVIAAHLGGYERWDAALEYLQPSDRLRFDTSSSSAFLPPEKFMEHFRRFGTDHYFFGVDFPMWSHKNEIHFIMNLNLSSLEKKAIFSENFKNWLRL